MDQSSVQVVVSALTAGAAAGMKDTASQAVKDSYAAVKTRIGHLLGNGQASAVAELEQAAAVSGGNVTASPAPGDLEAAGGGVLAAAGGEVAVPPRLLTALHAADPDEQLLDLARQLLELLAATQQPAGTTIYQNNAQKIQGVHQGTGDQHNTFHG